MKASKDKSVIPPWEKPAPKNAKHMKLTSSQKTTAKRRAAKAGRNYPNLVDNMSASKSKKATDFA